ncbi:MAG: trypsin-like peptidase domain-containing protein [Richelia sp. RM2_1_2]|nr:trypsin-like peptidase domain-containing protein [Richelia sp. RM2_1_2]
MKFYRICSSLTLLLIGSLVLIPSMQPYAKAFDENTLPARVQATEIDEWKIRDIAKQITVRIFSKENTASGILISKNKKNTGEYLYFVVTNNHVVANQQPDFSIETPDGKVHKASILSSDSEQILVDNTDNLDLEILSFSSPISYKKAVLGNSSNIKNEDNVFVAGFACQVHSCEKGIEFIFKSGTALLLSKPLVKGYQLGFTSETETGTSGGAVLNKKGELVAINGLGKHPILNGQYKYSDGISPSFDSQQFMRHFAWGIPINTYKSWSARISLDNISIPDSSNQEVSSSIQTTSPTLSYERRKIISIFIYILIIMFAAIAIIILFKLFKIKNKSENHQKLSSDNEEKQQDRYSLDSDKKSDSLCFKLTKRDKVKLELVELEEIKLMLRDVVNENNQINTRFIQLEKLIQELKSDNDNLIKNCIK